MQIGELSQRTGLSRDTIRFYEKQGLIEVGRRQNRFNNYKDYSLATFRRLQQIKRLKGFGFTLNETAGFLEMIEANEASCGNVSEKMTEKIALIDQKIAQLQAIKALMIDSVNQCLNTCAPEHPEDNCPILVSDPSSFL